MDGATVMDGHRVGDGDVARMTFILWGWDHGQGGTGDLGTGKNHGQSGDGDPGTGKNHGQSGIGDLGTGESHGQGGMGTGRPERPNQDCGDREMEGQTRPSVLSQDRRWEDG